MSIQAFGMAVYRKAIDNALDLATRATDYVGESRTLELLSSSLGRVCFRVNPAGVDEGALTELNRAVLAQLFWDEAAFVSSTMVNKQFALRLCIVNYTTTWEDVKRTLEANRAVRRQCISP